jgi:heme-degrading monooxygenase HmoA
VIVRIWHGRTARGVADEYAAFLARRVIPDYCVVPGNLQALVLRHDEGEVTHFLTVTRWASEDAIRAYAGQDVLKPKFYPEDTGYLLEFEPQVQQYTVVAHAP